MAEPSEGTPFLSDNDHRDTHDEPEDNYVKELPANSHFKQPLRILTAIISLLSLGVGIVLVAAVIFVKTGPFEHAYHTSEEARDLAICVSASSIQPYDRCNIANSSITGVRELRPLNANDLLPGSDSHQHGHPYRHVNCDVRLL